jgi:hypothetical protein
MYYVKSRNWNGKKWVLKLMKLSGVQSWEEPDFDEKFWLETPSFFRAIITWLWFMILRHWSGGWTYIVFPECSTPKNYGCISISK